MKKFTVADFFCGAGGFSEGFKQAGFDVVFGLDNWECARQTHKLNHPEAAHPGLDCFKETRGDILALNPENINLIVPDVDVIIGSPPCVSFSSSNRAGKADKSLGLKLIEKFLQIIAIKKYKPQSKLKYWIMENVPNSRHHIKNEYTFSMLGLNDSALHKLGIHKKPSDVAIKIIKDVENVYNSVNFGVPQKRERFVCGEFPAPMKKTLDKNKWVTLGQVIHALDKKKGSIIDPNYGFEIENKYLTDHFYDTIIPPFEWEEAKIRKQQARYYGKMSFPEDESQPSRTIMATRSVVSREAMILPNGSPGNFRSPTIREVASIMSFPITYQFQANNESSKYRLVGNAVCPKLSFSFAEAILKNEKVPVYQRINKHVNLELLNVNLRISPPPKKVAKDKHPESNFVEIVPNLKHNNFRVELDNNLPKTQQNRISWSASLHHATGKDEMKFTKSQIRDILILLKRFDNPKIIEKFIIDVEKTFSSNIPSKDLFQKQHVSANPNKVYLTPRRALTIIFNLVEKHFPKDEYEKVMITNNVNGKDILQFNRGKIPNNSIPLRILAAHYCTEYLVNRVRKTK